MESNKCSYKKYIEHKMKIIDQTEIERQIKGVKNDKYRKELI